MTIKDVGEILIWTSMSAQVLADELRVDLLVVTEAAAEQGVKQCARCGWWWPSEDMDKEGFCEECQVGP